MVADGRIGEGHVKLRGSVGVEATQRQQFIHWTGVQCRKILPRRIRPAILHSTGNVHRARRRQRDEFVLIDGELALQFIIVPVFVAEPVWESSA